MKTKKNPKIEATVKKTVTFNKRWMFDRLREQIETSIVWGIKDTFKDSEVVNPDLLIESGRLVDEIASNVMGNIYDMFYREDEVI
jgi:arginine decarboxylase-like protein